MTAPTLTEARRPHGGGKAKPGLPAWKRAGFDSAEEARQYRRSQYGTNSRRQQPKTRDWHHARVWTDAQETHVESFIDWVLEAVDRNCGREGLYPRDEHEAFVYEVGQTLDITLDDKCYAIKIMDRYSAVGRLRYRVKFPDGMTDMLTQAQLRKVVTPMGVALSIPLLPAGMSAFQRMQAERARALGERIACHLARQAAKQVVAPSVIYA